MSLRSQPGEGSTFSFTVELEKSFHHPAREDIAVNERHVEPHVANHDQRADTRIGASSSEAIPHSASKTANFACCMRKTLV